MKTRPGVGPTDRNKPKAAEDTGTGIEQPTSRKLEVRRETLIDLTPETRSAGNVKGGIPNQTKVMGNPKWGDDTLLKKE